MTITLDIVTTAALLFVVATGLLVIFGVLKIINFAHGAFLTIGAYGALATTAFNLNPWLSFPLAFVIGAAVGLLVERLVVQQRQQSDGHRLQRDPLHQPEKRLDGQRPDRAGVPDRHCNVRDTSPNGGLA